MIGPFSVGFGWAVLRAAIDFGYWVGVFFLLGLATVGDRRADASPPTPAEVYAAPVTIVVIAILLHAAASTLWRRRQQAR